MFPVISVCQSILYLGPENRTVSKAARKLSSESLSSVLEGEWAS